MAFIKTLDPNAGYALTNFITVDLTTAPTTWNDYSLGINIDASLAGQILQFGFLNTATYYEPSGMYYDNINWNLNGVIPTKDVSWGSLKSRF